MPRLIAFIPHPDDESYSFGGTLALAAKAGWECFIECASYGELGKRHDGGSTHPNEVAEAREAELVASCEALGAQPPEFWGLPDGELRLHRGEHDRIRGLFARLRPDLALTLGADGVYGHPDHIAVHRWVAEAWDSLDGEARPSLLFATFAKSLFQPQWEKCLRMLGDPPDPPAAQIGSDMWHYEVPVSAVRKAKLAAVAAHCSQLPGGDLEAMFPPGIVEQLLEFERFTDASGRGHEVTEQLLASLTS